MTLLAWAILGLVSGLIASKIINERGEGFVLNIFLGIVGAVVGGWLFSNVGMAGVGGLNLYSFFVATAGAMAILAGYHVLVRSKRY